MENDLAVYDTIGCSTELKNPRAAAITISVYLRQEYFIDFETFFFFFVREPHRNILRLDFEIHEVNSSILALGHSGILHIK